MAVVITVCLALPQRIGCPILRVFCEGWDATAPRPRPFPPRLLLIPPFAESAKDGAPDPLWQGKRYSPLPFDLSLVFITLGEPHAHGDTAEVVP